MGIQVSLTSTTVYRLRLSASNAYLLLANGAVLVDSGLKGEAKRILAAVKARGVQPLDLKLILLTHGHMDHAGAAKEVSNHTGAPIAMHASDARWVSSHQEVPAPPVTSWARMISRLLSVPAIRKRMAMEPFTPDIILGDGDFTLYEFGIPGIAIHTPGHTAGSVSVLLEDGRAVVGDMAMNGFPSLRFQPSPPIVAQNLGELAQSWRVLCARGATTAYPGHGASFPSRSLKLIA